MCVCLCVYVCVCVCVRYVYQWVYIWVVTNTSVVSKKKMYFEVYYAISDSVMCGFNKHKVVHNSNVVKWYLRLRCVCVLH